jgi:predicted transcriptional regulator of viral defense system
MGLAVVLIAIFGAPLFAEPVSRQADITEQFGVPESTLANWLGEWEANGLIARVQEGRCKVITLPKASATVPSLVTSD